jgi:hypothetical protein
MALVGVEQLGIYEHPDAPYYLYGHKKPVALVLSLLEEGYGQSADKTEYA